MPMWPWSNVSWVCLMGSAPRRTSTAALARTLDCPVILVLDVVAMSGTAAALVLECQRMQPGVQLAGLVLNRVGSEGHLQSTAEAIRAVTGLPVLGSLPDDAALAVPRAPSRSRAGSRGRRIGRC